MQENFLGMHLEDKASSTEQQPKRYKLLLATNHLFGWTGSETLLLTLIEELLERGHEVVVYVRHLDKAWAERHIHPNAKLTNSLDSVKTLKFDVAHVQHSPCLIDVRATFPTLPILFPSLGVLPFLEQPIPFEVGVSRFLAISEEVAANLAAYGIDERRIHIVRNLVSDSRFHPSSPIRERPERILVLSYKMDAARREALRMAAEKTGASIRFAGSAGEQITQDNLVVVINEADIVVSLGRGVIEAMLCGRVPLVYDIHGGDGLVTPDTLKDIRQNNFSGRRYSKEYTIENLVAEIGKYRQEFGAQLRDLALEQFGTQQNLPLLLEIYDTLLAEPAPDLLPVQTMRMLEFCSKLAGEEVKLQEVLTRENEQLAKELARVKATVSWQVTKPLRLLANLPRLTRKWLADHQGH